MDIANLDRVCELKNTLDWCERARAGLSGAEDLEIATRWGTERIRVTGETITPICAILAAAIAQTREEAIGELIELGVTVA